MGVLLAQGSGAGVRWTWLLAMKPLASASSAHTPGEVVGDQTCSACI